MIDRRNPRGAIASIREAVARLPKDWSVVIFPEGTRSKTGDLKTFKKGCIHVALATRYPIVPMAVHGVRELTSTPGWWPSWLPRPGTLQIAIGEPIPTDAWTPEALAEQLAQVHTAVGAQLSRARAAWAAAAEKNRPASSHIMETQSRPE
jgi:putative phosphoserine phosphatase/1-acylglycerol-3-phosphate O-acyltransferase